MNHICFLEKFEEIINIKAKCIKIATGFDFTEGPVWDNRNNQLIFTDFRNYKIYKWSKKSGLSIYMEHKGRVVGLAMNNNGNLIACESLNRRVTEINSDGLIKVIASHYDGCKLNSPNDVIVKSNGDIYFSDPYSKSLSMTKELGYSAVFKVDKITNEISIITNKLTRPNGLAFSLDETKIYINDSETQIIEVHDILKKEEPSVFFKFIDKKYGKGGVDGMKIDADGNLYVTGSGGIWVFDNKGNELGIIRIDEPVGNFCFGGEYGNMLFVTASTSVYILELNKVVSIKN